MGGLTHSMEVSESLSLSLSLWLSLILSKSHGRLAVLGATSVPTLASMDDGSLRGPVKCTLGTHVPRNGGAVANHWTLSCVDSLLVRSSDAAKAWDPALGRVRGSGTGCHPYLRTFALRHFSPSSPRSVTFLDLGTEVAHLGRCCKISKLLPPFIPQKSNSLQVPFFLFLGHLGNCLLRRSGDRCVRRDVPYAFSQRDCLVSY